MTYEYRPRGICASKINFDVEDGIVKNVSFTGGCNGNTQGIAKLAEGRSAVELISLLDGIKCGFKNTSCPDQLATALKEISQK